MDTSMSTDSPQGGDLLLKKKATGEVFLFVELNIFRFPFCYLNTLSHIA